MRNTPFISFSTGKHTLLLWITLVLVIDITLAVFTQIANYVAFPILLIWLVPILQSNNRLSTNEHVFVKASFLFLAMVLFYWVIGYSVMSTTELLRNFCWLITGVFSVYVIKLFSDRELLIVYVVLAIALFILLTVFISIGRTIIVYEDQSDASSVAQAWYGSVFMLITGLSLIVLLHVKSVIIKLIALVFFLLTLYFNFTVLQRGSNVIFTAVEIGMILAFTLKKKGLVYFLSIVVFGGAVFVYVSGALIDLFDWLADITPSTRLAYRFHSISNALLYEDISVSGSSMAARSNLMKISWDTFTSSFGHFVFGAGEHMDNKLIGHHSFFLDTLARYGIFGGVMIFVYFKKQYQIIMSFIDRKTNWALYMQCAVVFLIYVFRNYYGQVAYALVNLVILILFPLTFQIINYYKQKVKKCSLLWL